MYGVSSNVITSFIICIMVFEVANWCNLGGGSGACVVSWCSVMILFADSLLLLYPRQPIYFHPEWVGPEWEAGTLEA